MEKKTAAAYRPDRENVRIDKNGKASDMDARTVMSHDGCNPVNRDREMQRAHSGGEMLFPGSLPGATPGSLPGSLPESMPPVPPILFRDGPFFR